MSKNIKIRKLFTGKPGKFDLQNLHKTTGNQLPINLCKFPNDVTCRLQKSNTRLGRKDAS